MSTTIDDIHRGHFIEVCEHHDGTFEALSSVLNESITDLDKEEKDDKLQYVYGYIDGWKDAGGP